VFFKSISSIDKIGVSQGVIGNCTSRVNINIVIRHTKYLSSRK